MNVLKKIIKKDLSLEEVSMPESKEGFVLIKVVCSGICRTDIYAAEGVIHLAEDRILGHEFCGYVEKDSGDFKKGDFVTANPLIGDKFVGLDYDGSFSDYISLPSSSIYKLPHSMSMFLGAYIEPIAASLAPLKALASYTEESSVGILGKNRIAKLTQSILLRKGIVSEIFELNDDSEKKFDFIIETIQSEESFDLMISKMNKNGTIILKSRNPNKVKINFNEVLKKEISLVSTYYADFSEAIIFANYNNDLFEPFFGDTFSLSDWELAFKADKKGDKKYFFVMPK
jgi:L-iditol 2-dehydrogenase